MKKIEVEPVVREENWDNFLKKEKGSFLQSFFWGDFKKKYQEVYRFCVKKDGKLLGVCQIFKENNPFGFYFYIPHGPFSHDKDIREALFREARVFAKKKKAIFLKAEPLEKIDSGEKSFFRIQPQKTLISQIKEPEEMLKSFRKSTRHNIRYAKRKGVLVEKSKEIDSFYKILLKTKERQGFKSYNYDYFQQILELPGCNLFLARKNGDVLGGIIALHFGSFVYFLHSASDYKKRKFHATALLRFEVLKEARENECLFYDFWGIDEKKFPGVTAFKKGFNGREVIFPDGRDVVFKKSVYLMYKTLKRAKEAIV